MGHEYGAIQLPRVGQEVIIDFVGQDPDLPMIIGIFEKNFTMLIGMSQATMIIKLNTFHDEVAKFGSGKSIHAHGTTSDLMKYRPKEFTVILPSNF